MKTPSIPSGEPDDLLERIIRKVEDILVATAEASETSRDAMPDSVRKFRRSVLMEVIRKLDGRKSQPEQRLRTVAGLELAEVVAEIQGLRRETLTSLRREYGPDASLNRVERAFDDSCEELIRLVLRGDRAADAMLGPKIADFLDLLAHDLRNPLSAMCNALKLLEFEQCVSERGMRALKLLALQIQRVTRTADTIQDFSGVHKGTLQIRKTRLDATELLRGISSRAKETAELTRHRIEWDLTQESAIIDSDPLRLEQIVMNLLAYAMKYTIPSGEIKVMTSIVDHDLRISVRDSGQGLSPEMKSNIFNPFVEVNSASKKGQRINLSLTKALVERLGGKIEVFSDGASKGSEIRVEFPLVGPQTQGAARPSATESRPMKILLTDDDMDAVELFTLLLGEKGYIVRSAHDGASALRECKDFSPDVILLDIGLPDMTGIELAKRLRQMPNCSDAVFVALSGHSKEFLLENFSGGEFDHFLTKSFKFDNVADLLDRLASRISRSA